MADELNPRPHENLVAAREALRQGKLESALQLYQLHLRNRPSAEPHSEMAAAYRSLHQPRSAIRHYREAIRLDSGNAEAHRGLGITLLELGAAEEGLQSLRRAVELRPEDAAGVHALIAALTAAGQRVEALRWIERFLLESVRKPNSSETRANLAIALLRAGETDEALREMVHAVSLEPESADLRCTLGAMLAEVGRYQQARDSFTTALRLDPGHLESRRRRACELLRSGEWREGWRERATIDTELASGSARPELGEAIWDGSDPAGKTILLHGGLDAGESIQLVRYASLLAEAGARVVLECEPSLVRLFARLSYLDTIVPRGHRLPSFDVHAPLTSLPALFGTTLGTVPTRSSYLELEREEDQHHAEGSTDPAPIRIGVAASASGGPGSGAESTEERLVARLRELGFQVVPLIDPASAADADAEPHPPAEAPATDLLDMARAMIDLDLVITRDGVPAHLAGALGLTVWVLIPYPPHWRWLIDRDTTPWYPTMRLFRQGAAQDPEAVHERIIAEVRGYQPVRPAPDPQGVAPTPMEGEDADRIFQTGVKAHLAGDLERAENAYRRTISLFPGFAEAHNNLGVLLRERDPLESLAHFRDTVRLAPGEPDGLLNLGWALIDHGELEEAVEVLQRASAADPSNLEARQHLSTLLRELGYERAEEAPLASDATGAPETLPELQVEPQSGEAPPRQPEPDSAARPEVGPEIEPGHPGQRREPRRRASTEESSPQRRAEFRLRVIQPVLEGIWSAREAAEAVRRFARGRATETDLARIGPIPRDLARRYRTLTARSVQLWAKKARDAMEEARAHDQPSPALADVLRHRQPADMGRTRKRTPEVVALVKRTYLAQGEARSAAAVARELSAREDLDLTISERTVQRIVASQIPPEERRGRHQRRPSESPSP